MAFTRRTYDSVPHDHTARNVLRKPGFGRITLFEKDLRRSDRDFRISTGTIIRESGRHYPRALSNAIGTVPAHGKLRAGSGRLFAGFLVESRRSRLWMTLNEQSRGELFARPGLIAELLRRDAPRRRLSEGGRGSVISRRDAEAAK